MEDSRKGKKSEEKGLKTPNPYVDGKNGRKVIVYNTKEEKRKGVGEKQEELCTHK